MKLRTQTTDNQANAKHRKVLAKDQAGREYILSCSARVGSQIQDHIDEGTVSPKISANLTGGSIKDVLDDNHVDTARAQIERFSINLPPLKIDPYIPERWEKLLAKWIQPKQGGHPILLQGDHGTGKDTFEKVFAQRYRKTYKNEKVQVFGIPFEHDDRYVGHIPTKLNDLANTVQHCKERGDKVLVFGGEIEALFGIGEFTSSHQVQIQARLRDLLDGTVRFEPDVIIFSGNNLNAIGPAVLSRLQIVRFPLEQETIRGILEVHWPNELVNGTSCQHIVGRLINAKVAELTHRSQKRSALRMIGAKALNARFLSFLADDVRHHVETKRSQLPGFEADSVFLDKVLAEHIEAALTPMVDAVGTRALRGHLVEEIDPFDPPVQIRVTTDWSNDNEFLV